MLFITLWNKRQFREHPVFKDNARVCGAVGTISQSRCPWFWSNYNQHNSSVGLKYLSSINLPNHCWIIRSMPRYSDQILFLTDYAIAYSLHCISDLWYLKCRSLYIKALVTDMVMFSSSSGSWSRFFILRLTWKHTNNNLNGHNIWTFS